MHVDTSSADAPVPVQYIQKLEPFNGPEIAVSTTLYDGFNGTAPAASNFDVVNLASCPESQNCQQNSGLDIRTRLPNLQRPKTIAEIAELLRPAHATHKRATAGVQTTGNATWANDFSVHESAVMIINQGGVEQPDGSICCTASFAGQCQVQMQSHIGQLYHDFTNQRSRFEDIAQGTYVDDYKLHKSLEVQTNGTHDVCVKYCPMDPEDTLDGGRDEFVDPNATDLGKTTYEGQPAEHWTWKETAFKIITMQTTDFYANVDGATAVPLGAITQLTPFGQHLGTQNSSWTTFTPGTPPASKFDIQGVDSCPLDPQCGQQKHQLRRLARRQLHTFARYAELVPQ